MRGRTGAPPNLLTLYRLPVDLCVRETRLQGGHPVYPGPAPLVCKSVCLPLHKNQIAWARVPSTVVVPTAPACGIKFREFAESIYIAGFLINDSLASSPLDLTQGLLDLAGLHPGLAQMFHHQEDCVPFPLTRDGFAANSHVEACEIYGTLA